MIDNTIDDAKTLVGGGKDMILAGRGKPIRQPARGGAREVSLEMV